MQLAPRMAAGAAEDSGWRAAAVPGEVSVPVCACGVGSSPPPHGSWYGRVHWWVGGCWSRGWQHRSEAACRRVSEQPSGKQHGSCAEQQQLSSSSRCHCVALPQTQQQPCSGSWLVAAARLLSHDRGWVMRVAAAAPDPAVEPDIACCQAAVIRSALGTNLPFGMPAAACMWCYQWRCCWQPCAAAKRSRAGRNAPGPNWLDDGLKSFMQRLVFCRPVLGFGVSKPGP